MMYPILCKVRYESLHELFSHRSLWKQIAFSIFVNWVVAPFFMVLFALFAYKDSDDDAKHLVHSWASRGRFFPTRASCGPGSY